MTWHCWCDDKVSTRSTERTPACDSHTDRQQTHGNSIFHASTASHSKSREFHTMPHSGSHVVVTHIQQPHITPNYIQEIDKVNGQLTASDDCVFIIKSTNVRHNKHTRCSLVYDRWLSKIYNLNTTTDICDAPLLIAIFDNLYATSAMMNIK